MSELATTPEIADAIAEQLDDDDRQLGLFAPPATEAGRLKIAGIATRIGPGRPPGARNKRTEATVAHLLQRYRDPRAVALERIQMHPADLAAVLGCTLFEASQEQRLYLQAVMPFLHARITPEVIDNRSVIYLTINGSGSGVVGGSEATPTRILESTEYQEVTADGSERE